MEVLPLTSKCTGLPNNQIKCTICGLTWFTGQCSDGWLSYKSFNGQSIIGVYLVTN